MCTAATYQTKDFYFGRTLDYECSYGECVTVTPRRYPFSFRHMGRLDAHYAMIGMAHVADGYPLYYDAVNEAGLGMAGLNFVGNVEANTALLGGAAPRSARRGRGWTHSIWSAHPSASAIPLRSCTGC